MKSPFIPICLALTALLVCLMAYFGIDHNSASSGGQSADAMPNAERRFQAVEETTDKKSDVNAEALLQMAPQKVVLSNASIEAVVEEEVNRLQKPCGSLFQQWGLRNTEVRQFFELYGEKIRTRLNNPMIAGGGSDSNTADIDSKLIHLVGGTKRFYDVTSVITKSNMAHYKATQKERVARQELHIKQVEKEVADLKRTYGGDYVVQLRNKYGDQIANSMLRLIDLDRD